MNKYLLLRDNKQTGPYTAAELVKKGIKPYDLVWLEGRSAAWRYPSEMDELKAHAPVVEEQPYDRFYKRSSSAQEHAIHAAQQQSGKEEQAAAEDHITETPFIAIQPVQQPAVAAQASSVTTPVEKGQPPVVQLPQAGTGKVYVTLPAGFKPRATSQVVEMTPVQAKPEQTSVTVAESAESAAVSEEAVKALEARAEALARSVQKAAEETAAKKQAAHKSLEEQYGPKPVSVVSDKQPAASQKAAKPVSQPVPFSKPVNTDQELHSTPVIAMNASGRKHRFLMRSIVAVCLLLGGIVIGMALTYSKSASASQQALDQLVLRLQEREAQRAAGNTEQPQPGDESAQPSSGSLADEEAPPPNDDQSLTEPVPSRQLALREKEPPPTIVQKEPAISYQEKQPVTMKVTPAVITQKEEPKPVREADISVAREKIFQMVQVAASPFQTGVLGGISNLYFTISNTSSFPLDQIELEIKYLGPERRVVKVQRLIFNDIAANGQKTLEAPRTSRGVSIDYVVTKINSRALGIARAGF
ncbi:MAG: hypothetical protein ACTHMC_25090 [Pseudobacter sp.]|uniref:hypothetical protein n=1 Tax=Pseudobacter sp. TaxID=2045420 RepID=UPI003F7E5790